MFKVNSLTRKIAIKPELEALSSFLANRFIGKLVFIPYSNWATLQIRLIIAKYAQNMPETMARRGRFTFTFKLHARNSYFLSDQLIP
jgi:hypothetical protein